MYPLTVTICNNGLAAGEDGAPKCETSIVVDGVICLSEEDEVTDGGVFWLWAEVREDDPGVEEVLPTPVHVVTGDQEHRARVSPLELFDGLQEELSANLLALVALLYKLYVVRPSDVDTEIQISQLKHQLYRKVKIDLSFVFNNIFWATRSLDNIGNKIGKI